MQKKLIAAAVAGALASPVAFAQSAVTISGVFNFYYESNRANNATAGSGANIHSHDRLRDANGSNIRFTVTEDLGGGLQAFGQVETAVFLNGDTRNTAFGASPTAAPTGIQTAGGWSTRNTGVGLRSKAWGEILMGIWDVHWNESVAADGFWVRAGAHGSVLALMNGFGSIIGANPTIGARYSNVIRYQSPRWGGFDFVLAYARPSDGSPVNAAGDIRDSKKNRVWSFSPRYNAGPLHLSYSYLQDKDNNVAAPLSQGGTNFSATAVAKVTSNRIAAQYRFGMGLNLGFLWDSSKLDLTNTGAFANSSVKRSMWGIPVSFTSGSHQFGFTYAKARDWQGNLAGVAVGTQGAGTLANSGGMTYGGNTGATFYTFGYTYAMSKRTNLHLQYSRIRNEGLAIYDFFANPSGLAAANAGADPRIMSIGLRHAF